MDEEWRQRSLQVFWLKFLTKAELKEHLTLEHAKLYMEGRKKEIKFYLEDNDHDEDTYLGDYDESEEGEDDKEDNEEE